MKQHYTIAIISLIILLTGYAQNPKEDWVTHILQKEKGPMVITSNLYYNFMGKPNYKNLLLVGTSTRDCKKNGYPDELGLAKFYLLSDSIASKLDKLTKKRLVGIVTYQCTGIDVYYIKDTTGVKNTIQSLLDYNYAFSKNYLLLKYDKKWQYYKQNLIPEDFSDEFFMNHDFLNQLVIEGDDLTKPRKVDHWINFRNEKRRSKFIEKVKPLGFAVDSLKVLKAPYFKYQLKISREDAIHPKAISKLTEELSKLSLLSYGIYDGWAAEPPANDQ